MTHTYNNSCTYKNLEREMLALDQSKRTHGCQDVSADRFTGEQVFPTQAIGHNISTEKAQYNDSDHSQVSINNSRHRMTSLERKNFMEQCVSLYEQGQSTKLIAYKLGVREADVKHVLFDFLQKHPEQIVETKIFLATPNTRMKDICGKDSRANYFEVELKVNQTLICKPLN